METDGHAPLTTDNADRGLVARTFRSWKAAGIRVMCLDAPDGSSAIWPVQTGGIPVGLVPRELLATPDVREWLEGQPIEDCKVMDITDDPSEAVFYDLPLDPAPAPQEPFEARSPHPRIVGGGADADAMLPPRSRDVMGGAGMGITVERARKSILDGDDWVNVLTGQVVASTGPLDARDQWADLVVGWVPPASLDRFAHGRDSLYVVPDLMDDVLVTRWAGTPGDIAGLASDAARMVCSGPGWARGSERARSATRGLGLAIDPTGRAPRLETGKADLGSLLSTYVPSGPIDFDYGEAVDGLREALGPDMGFRATVESGRDPLNLLCWLDAQSSHPYAIGIADAAHEFGSPGASYSFETYDYPWDVVHADDIGNGVWEGFLGDGPDRAGRILAAATAMVICTATTCAGLPADEVRHWVLSNECLSHDLALVDRITNDLITGPSCLLCPQDEPTR